MQIHTDNQTHRTGVIRRKLLLAIFAIPVLLAALYFGGREMVRHQQLRERAAWKTETLPRLAALSFTNAEIRADLDAFKQGTSLSPNHGWAQDHVLVMTNGTYLIYASRHGFNNGFVDHLFLAHSSDNRWFYSTYHFCNQMAALVNDDPPGSIAEFAKTYSAREFDGKSDECLKHTWPRP